MKYHFRIRKEKRGFSAQCIELEGCITEGDSFKELQKNMQEALNLYIQEPEDSEDLAPLPNESIRKSKFLVEVALDPEIAFSFLVRYYRFKHGMTQYQVAKKMGFDKIYSYQRLESKKCNPTLKMISMIKKVFPDFSIDYAVSC
ncbi:MAG TPA: type II toxin-antitoxin system HicB family antitoxin [Rhabdochlamydiaceae bacterium]|nr:type II toxin-antitoxin system HicB family antitoxin [Rhabdochlamydiaceae bacterium]